MDAQSMRARRASPIDAGAAFAELGRLLGHPCLERALFFQPMRRCVLAHVLRDLHRAEVWPAHRTEVRPFRRFGRKGLVVEAARALGVEREVELIFPPELEARLAERVVPRLRAGMALREVGR